jgi:hypothetical protein
MCCSWRVGYLTKRKRAGSATCKRRDSIRPFKPHQPDAVAVQANQRLFCGSLPPCCPKLSCALTAPLKIRFVQGLAKLRRSLRPLTLTDEAIGAVGANGDACYAPELLRVRHGLLLTMPEPSRDDAGTCFVQSLELSRHQGARAWVLRTAIDLATLWADRQGTERARALLQPVFETFEKGSDTADLKDAERLLATFA